MNALSKALSDLRFKINRNVLDTVFVKRHQHYNVTAPSLEEQILNEVIRPRVYMDCNLVGGTEVIVPLNGLIAEEVNTTDIVYRVPKSLTNGRTIMSVKNITYMDAQSMAAAGNFATCGVSAEQTAMQSLLDAVSPLPMISTGRCSIIGENVVYVKDSIRVPSNSYMLCVVAHDEAMSHLQPRSYMAFSKLVEYAVKAYIFTEYELEMDMGELRGGHSLGKFKDIIDRFSDANELYDDYLREKFQKIQVQNDTLQMNRLIRLKTGGPR